MPMIIAGLAVLSPAAGDVRSPMISRGREISLIRSWIPEQYGSGETRLFCQAAQRTQARRKRLAKNARKIRGLRCHSFRFHHRTDGSISKSIPAIARAAAIAMHPRVLSVDRRTTVSQNPVTNRDTGKMAEMQAMQ